MARHFWQISSSRTSETENVSCGPLNHALFFRRPASRYRMFSETGKDSAFTAPVREATMIVSRFQLFVPILLFLVLLVGWPPAEAAPTVGGVNADPVTVQINSPTSVKVTTVITDPSLIAGGALLQRINADGSVTNLGVMRDDGAGGDAVAGDGVYTLVLTVNESQTGKIRVRVSAAFKGVLKRVLSAELAIPVGAPVPAGFGVTVRSSSGAAITVEPAATEVPTVVGIATVPRTAIVSPAVNVSVVTAVEVVLEPTERTESFQVPSGGLQISVPAPAGTLPTAKFVVALQALVDSTDGVSGLRPQLIAQAFAGVVGNEIVTQNSVLPGIVQAGTYAVVSTPGSGFVAGVVSDANGPAAGVVISNSSNSLVAISEADGSYSLFISGDAPFTLTAFHPLRFSRGTAVGTLPGHLLTAIVNISLAPLPIPQPTRDGIRNGGFERCTGAATDSVGNLTGSWAFDGDAKSIQEFVTLSGVRIRPTEGKCMAQISTVVGTSGSISQRFIVPAGAQKLSFDFNFVSEEFDEYIGSVFNDTFTAVVKTPEGETTITRVQVNDFMSSPGGFTMIGDCVTGGDDTCGQLVGTIPGRPGWVTASVDLSRFSNPSTASVTVELIFSVVDRGDTLFDTFVFIDNIRFGTVWVDAKVVSGANSSLARVEADVRQATEVLSQAGLNVQLRGVTSIADPANLTDVDTNWNPPPAGPNTCSNAAQIDATLTVEEAQVMLLPPRSPTPTDINVYYVRAGTRTLNGVPNTAVRLAGYAIGPDEYCNQVSILTNAGIFIMDYAIGNLGVLAHEIGHLAVGPDPFSTTNEHGVQPLDPSNIMVGSPMPPTNGVINRTQSANINRLGAPLILP
jgi:hypothetical protein